MGRWLGILIVAALAFTPSLSAAKDAPKRDKKLRRVMAEKKQKMVAAAKKPAAVRTAALIESADGTSGFDPGGN